MKFSYRTVNIQNINMLFIERIKKIIPVLLVPVVMLWFFNSVNYRHYHKLPDGSVIAHAHPYNKKSSDPKPFKTHNHTAAEFFLLSFLSNPILLLGLLFICAGKNLFYYKVLISPLSINPPVKRFYPNRNYRAPPFQF